MSTMLTLPLLPGVTSLNAVHLFPDAAMTGSAIILPVEHNGSLWQIDTVNVPAGRYWPRLHGAKNGSPYTYPYPDGVLDLPYDETMVASPEALAVSVKMPLPLDAEQRATIREAILDAQAAVETYLQRPITPRTYVESGLDDFGDTWDFQANNGDPVLRIVSVVAETDGGTPTGLFTVTYVAGLDARTDPALRLIRRYVIAHAKNSPEFYDLWIEVVKPKGTVKSLTAEGQSVTFEKPSLGVGTSKPGDGSPGAVPTLQSLDYWRLRAVYQARSRWWEPVP